MISAYLESLASALSFDRALSRRVLQEVEDHLREALAADASGDRLEAERRAIAAFGAPRVVAAQFALPSLASQTRTAAIALLGEIAAVFVAMKARIAWYAASSTHQHPGALQALAGTIDRYAFWFSVAVGIAGWAYVVSRSVPMTFRPAFRKQVRRCSLLCAAAAGVLIVVVASDAVLTAARLTGLPLLRLPVVPLVSLLFEIECAVLLAVQFRNTTRRTASAIALLTAAS